MKNFKLFLIPALILTGLSMAAFQDVDYADFLKKYDSQWALRCPKCGDLSPKSYTAKYRNTSKEKLDIKIALQKENKKWDVFVFNNLAPNDTVQVCVCNGTSKALKWARKAGDVNTIMPTEQEINNQY